MATIVISTHTAHDHASVKPRSRSFSLVVLGAPPKQSPRFNPIPIATVRPRRRTVTSHSSTLLLPVLPPQPQRNPFSRLPAELVWSILSAASTSSTEEAKTVSLVCKHARRLALPALFSVRTLRDARSVQELLVHVQMACPLTPVGALVTSLWLTVTRAWPVEAVRAVVRACPNIERLALTNISGLAPWISATEARPLFADALPGRNLELTLVGHNTAEDVRAFAEHDPPSAAMLARRLTALRVLKLRSAFPSRSTGTPGAVGGSPPGMDVDADEGVVAAMVALCPNLKVVSVPYGQIASTMQDSVLESSFEKELDLLGVWVKETAMHASTTVELLMNAADLKHIETVEGFEKKRKSFNRDLRMVDWPRNVDAARERWIAEH